MRGFARAFLATATAAAAGTPVAAQTGPVLEGMAGPSRAIGGEFEKRVGLLLEGGAATSDLGAGLRVGLRLSLELRPESGRDDCISVPGSTNFACRAKAPTLAGVGPELRWRASPALGFRVGGGVVRSGEGEGAGAAVHVGLDLSRALGARSRALLAVRLQTASGVADQRVTTLGVALGLQRLRRRRRAPAGARRRLGGAPVGRRGRLRSVLESAGVDPTALDAPSTTWQAPLELVPVDCGAYDGAGGRTGFGARPAPTMNSQPSRSSPRGPS